MKKNYFLGKNLLILLTGSLIATSCMTDTESPVIQDDQVEIALEETGGTGDENLRKGGFMPYEDTFYNSITPTFGIDGLYFPGTGTGKARGLGKSYSFLNQRLSEDGTLLLGAPVKDYYTQELNDFGIDSETLDDKVSTVVINERGHALFIESEENELIRDIVNPDIIYFNAKINIVGGTKIYKDAAGSGTVNGWFDESSNEGVSKVSATIKLK
ncbi:MAG: hypothetical protein HWE15_07715 [Algoriphagus sp.]|uniref:hypothetical protein n=1 Tax=Algoriphagus sp. TaxID=1872435 RepID=UPI00181C2B28|nr:hypothetical protein [Algoriphagus sp.]NVJ86178.1 hypothetical protein [Algoriphagus sp.]